MLLMIIGVLIAMAMFLIVYIDKRRLWPVIKERWFGGVPEEKEDPDVYEPSDDLIIKFQHPEFGVVRHERIRERGDGKFDLVNHEGHAYKKNLGVGNFNLLNLKQILKRGVSPNNELIFQILDSSYYQEQVDKERTLNRKISNLTRQAASASKPAHTLNVERAREENIVAKTKWHGRRTQQYMSKKDKGSGSSSTSEEGAEPAEGMEE